MRNGCVKNVEERIKIVSVVFDRLGYRLSHSLESRKMNHSIDFVTSEQILHLRGVAAIHKLERNVVPSGNLFHSLEAGHIAVGHIVRHHHIIARIDELHRHVAADISGTT